MAGIGFKIQKLLSEDTYWGVLRGYLYSAVISSGPWLISIVCIGALGFLSKPIIGHRDHDIFRAWVIYCYAASLIVSGGLQMAMTRHLSDSIYKNETEEILSSFFTVSAVLLPFQFLFAAAYLLLAGYDWAFVLVGSLLYAVISGIWVTMIYLSAARDYVTIVLAYIVGGAVSYFAAMWLAPRLGLIGVLSGYTMGQIVLLAVLAARLVMEFPLTEWFSLGAFRFIHRSWVLVAIGLSYNAGIWADKVLYWFFWPERKEVAPGLYCCPFYETPTFLAFITIVPTMSLFLIRIETSFYRTYRTYYMRVMNKYPLAGILEAKAAMLESLRLSFYRLLVLQGSVTALCIAYSYWMVQAFGMEANQLAVLRICILAAFLHAILMVLFIIVLYFDWKGLALQLAMIFLCANLIGTRAAIGMDLSCQGYGYFFACLVTLAWGLLRFHERFEDLEYITFTSQPLGRLAWDETP